MKVINTKWKAILINIGIIFSKGIILLKYKFYVNTLLSEVSLIYETNLYASKYMFDDVQNGSCICISNSLICKKNWADICKRNFRMN